MESACAPYHFFNEAFQAAGQDLGGGRGSVALPAGPDRQGDELSRSEDKKEGKGHGHQDLDQAESVVLAAHFRVTSGMRGTCHPVRLRGGVPDSRIEAGAGFSGPREGDADVIEPSQVARRACRAPGSGELTGGVGFPAQ